MEKKETRNKIVNQIWDLRRRIQMWNFIFGKDSSQSKIDEFTQFFTNWISYELQECLETRILIDLRGLLDQSSNEVTSMYKIFDKAKLKMIYWCYAAVLFALIILCQIQTYQYRYTLIHWSDMTREKYWDVFLRVDRIGK